MFSLENQQKQFTEADRVFEQLFPWFPSWAQRSRVRNPAGARQKFQLEFLYVIINLINYEKK